MKSLGWLTGCALALACAHAGKGVVGESDTNKQGAVAAEASQPQAASTADAATAAIRPFHVDVPEKALVDLRQRIAATRWPDRETVTDRSQGAQLAKIQALVRYWGTGYDWRKAEAKLNALPQFVTKIDGLDIHFIHVRSRHKNALPVIITHGWPGSVLELIKVIGRLTDPTAHGGRAEDAFDVVIPSVPGYGFSGKPIDTGWDPEQSPTKDEVLDDFTLYWLTNSATSSARLYWENGGRGVTSAAAQKTAEISLPVAITVFPDDVYRPPETWARRAYRNLIYFHEVDKGGHFAAWEQPQLFAAEIRAAFKSLRPADRKVAAR